MSDGAGGDGSATSRELVRRWFVIVATFGITAVFVMMIRQFLMPLLLAGIFTGLVYPIYRWLLRVFRQRRMAASAATIAIVLLLVIGPLSSIVGLIVAQAAEVTRDVSAWFEERGRTPGLLDWAEEKLPFVERLEPYREQIVDKAGQLAGQTGSFLLKWLSETTRGTLAFLLQLFVFLYAMFFFLMDGPALVRRMLYYLPMPDEDEQRMLERFVSVTRATLKGTLVIGLLQGALAGAAFAVAGIRGSIFWGTLMAVLSIIPGVGSALIWGPAVAFLLLTGRVAAGVGLLIWCAAVVGSVDNFLRPRLVGSDTELPDLLILLGTLGGLFLFGAAGIIIGPIVAALFVTIWEIYGATFREALEPGEAPAGGG